jgi:hypothetical protein
LKKSIQALEVNLKKSVKLRVFLGVIFLLALVSCWLNGLSMQLQLLLTAIVILFFYLSLKSNIATNKDILTIRCCSDGYWELVHANNKIIRCALAGSSKALGPLYFLHFYSSADKFNLVVANDSMSSDEWRKLRVTLKIYTQQIQAASF